LFTNPAAGWRNPLAPPMEIYRNGDGRCWSDFTLGAAYEGPPGMAHGGIAALVLDQLLGEAATSGLTEPRFTGTISLRYLRGTPLGRLHAEAHVDRVEGHKTYARGFISDGQGPTVEAEGVFIMPAWARENQ
ncbi:MAG: PaaI family thioesterase, partial [Mycobacterium sp.]|nr:PaaI family thioesterase [Mycobacterium sp.]